MPSSILLIFLLLISNTYGVQYRIVVHTKNFLLAGTDETVSINLHGIANDGRLVESGFVDFVDSTGAMFEKNRYDHLTLEGGEIDNLIDVEVKIIRDGIYLDWWYLDWVKVWHGGNVYLAYFDVTFRSNRETYRSRNFYLECQPGFVETQFYGKKICQDRDECLDSCKGPGQLCKNTIGSFNCNCKEGFTSVPGGCQDIDECVSGLGQCPGANAECANTVGSYRCQCKPGYQGDGVNCIDYDECKKPEDNKCQQSCENTDGGFYCSCNPGYTLAPDKRSCLDIDECQSHSTCDPVTSVCYDKVGTFVCMCKRGYQPSKVTANKCIPVVCPRIYLNDANVVMSPPECSDEGRSLHNKCTFSCKPGYSLASYSSTFGICNEEGQWTIPVPPRCLPLSCPKITPPKDGNVVPADCATSGALEGERCYIYCNNGFKQIGVRDVTCHDQQYSADTGTVECVQIPNIKCPEDVNTVLPDDKSTVALADKYPSYTSTVLPSMITSSPPGVGPLYEFPEGMTKVTITAKNVLNETASCDFFVRVRDVSAPRIIYCPGPQYYLSNGDKITVTWPEPVFKDNIAIAHAFQSSKNEEQRNPSSFSVTYQVSDAKGNQAICKFDINIKVLGCNFDSFKGADQLTLKYCIPQGPTNALCGAQCAPGKTFDVISTNAVKTFFFCSKAIVNGRSNLFPSCVDFIQKTGQECPEGFIVTEDYRSGQSGKPVCGKCARGTFYDKASKSCRDCPVHTYSAAEGQFECTSCPEGKGTVDTRTIHVTKCIEKCPKGMKSVTGLQGTGDEACLQCPLNTYADVLGSTECKSCPKNTRTDGTGKSSISDCLKAPTVFFLQPVDFDGLVEGMTIRFLCLIDGFPLPYATVFKQNPIKDESMHGKHLMDRTLPTPGRIAVGYTITNATVKDSDNYFCKGENSEGEVKTSFELIITHKETTSP